MTRKISIFSLVAIFGSTSILCAADVESDSIDAVLIDSMTVEHTVTVGGVTTTASIGSDGSEFVLYDAVKTDKTITSEYNVTASKINSKVVTTLADALSTHTLTIEGKDATTFTSKLAGTHSLINNKTGAISTSWGGDTGNTYGMMVYANADGTTRYIVGTDPTNPVVDMNDSDLVGGKTTFATDETLSSEFNFKAMILGYDAATGATTEYMNTVVISTAGSDYHTTLSADLLNKAYHVSVDMEAPTQPGIDPVMNVAYLTPSDTSIKVNVTAEKVTMSRYSLYNSKIETITDTGFGSGNTEVKVDGEKVFTAYSGEPVEIDVDGVITRTIEFNK